MNPVASTDLEFQESAGEVLVHDQRHGKIHVMNPSAAKALSLCDGTRDVAAIARELGGGEDESARDDVERIIEQFRSLGLVDSSETQPA